MKRIVLDNKNKNKYTDIETEARLKAKKIISKEKRKVKKEGFHSTLGAIRKYTNIEKEKKQCAALLKNKWTSRLEYGPFSASLDDIQDFQKAMLYNEIPESFVLSMIEQYSKLGENECFPFSFSMSDKFAGADHLEEILIVSMSYNQKAWKAIDRLFNANIVEYSSILEKQDFRKRKYLLKSSLPQNDRQKKLWAILLSESGESKIEIIIKKEFSKVYSIYESFRKGDYTHYDSVIDDLFMEHEIVPSILYYLYKKNTDKFNNLSLFGVLTWQDILTSCQTNIKNTFNHLSYDDSLMISVSSLSEKYREAFNKFKSELEFESFEEYDTEKLRKSINERVRLLLYGTKMGKVTKNEYFMQIIELVSNTEKVSIGSIYRSHYLTKKEIQEIAIMYLELMDPDTTKDNWKLDVIVLALIKSYSKAMRASYEYADNLDTGLLIKEIAELKSQNESLVGTNLSLSNKINEIKLKAASNAESTFRKELFNTNRKNQELENKLKQYELQINELKERNNELGDMVDTLSSEGQNCSVGDCDNVDRSVLFKNKLVVIGGHESWHQKLNEKLKDNVRTIDGYRDFDEKIISNSDALFLYPKYMGHTQYWKAVDTAKKYNKIIYRLSGREISKTLDEMAMVLLRSG